MSDAIFSNSFVSVNGSRTFGMGGWRSETAADLADAARLIQGALGSVHGEPTEQQLRDIWLAYLRVEKSIAFIKFDIDEENPGRFIKLKAYAVPDERQALSFSLKSLVKGSDDFTLGDFRRALAELRDSRNYLRAMLREKRLRRARPTARR